MKKLIVIAALLGGTAHAQFIDGNKLLADMNGTHGTQMSALGYVMGVTDTLNGVLVCPPPNATSGQVRDMVYNYLTNVPAERSQSGDMLITKVLRSVWPCANRSNGGRQL